jgi:biopolymer transport protein ExbD
MTSFNGGLRVCIQIAPSNVIAVAGRPGARYAEVMEAMDVARSAGVRVISIVPKGL